MTTEGWVKTLSLYSLSIMVEQVGGILKKVGVAGAVHFPWEIILLMKSSHDNLSTRLFIKKIK